MNQSVARRATSSSVPRSSNRWVAPGTISSRLIEEPSRASPVIHLDHRLIIAANNQERWGQNEREEHARQVGPPAARHHGRDLVASFAAATSAAPPPVLAPK